MSYDGRATARISKEYSLIYDKITTDELSPFKDKDKTLVFVTAAAIGFKENKKSSNSGERQDLFVVNLLKDKEILWLMKAIAMSAEGVEVLKDLKKVTQICEEYANEGLHLLMDICESGKDNTISLAEAMSKTA